MRGVSLIEVIGGSFVETVDKKPSKVSTGEKSLLYPLFEMNESIYWNIKNS